MMALFRAGLLALGIVCALLAWREWTAGVPPLWSMLAHRAETRVVAAGITDEVNLSGRHHGVPHLQVAWPPGAESSAEVVGLRSGDVWHMHTAFEYLRDHPVGSAMTVRAVDGVPMADRTDLRALGYALAATLMAIVFLVPGLAPWRRRPGAEGEAG